jgi:hypothetical protein
MQRERRMVGMAHAACGRGGSIDSASQARGFRAWAIEGA